MDTALKLKKDFDLGLEISVEQALSILSESIVVQRLVAKLIDKSLFYTWRLIAMSEIPFAQHLDYTQDLISRVYSKMSTDMGFSLSGDSTMFLPCYNAMIVSALCRLGRAKDEQVVKAVEWIINNQPMERGLEVRIPHLNFDRYGGCFKATPCYIGLAKSVFALHDYHKATGDTSVNRKLDQGIEYLLCQHLAYRLTSKNPITRRIMDISFPATYNLNIVELIRFASEANLLADPRTTRVVEYIESQRKASGKWSIDYRYRADGYLLFDEGSNSGEWLSYVLSHALQNKPLSL